MPKNASAKNSLPQPEISAAEKSDASVDALVAGVKNASIADRNGQKSTSSPSDQSQSVSIPHPHSAGFEQQSGGEARNSPEKNSKPEYWSEDSESDSLGKMENIKRGFYSYFGGNKDDSKALYTPHSKVARPDTSKEIKGQGDHLIPFAFLSYAIMSSLKGSNIKTLDTQFNTMSEVILPNQNVEQEESDEVKQKRAKLEQSKGLLRGKFKNYRDVRKHSTGAMRRVAPEQIDEFKEQLKKTNRQQIRDAIEGVASDLIELLSVMPGITLDKSRQEKSTLNFKVAKGSDIKATLNSLIEFDEFLEGQYELNVESLQSEGASGTKRGEVLIKYSPGKGQTYNNRNRKPNEDLMKRLIKIREEPLTDDIKGKLVTNLSCLIDYPRTGVEGQDDEKVLYNTIARLMVITFNTFQGLKKLKLEDKKSLYDGFLDKVLKEQGWINHENEEDENILTHQVQNGKTTESITEEIVKQEVAKIASLDFENHIFQMGVPKINLDTPLPNNKKDDQGRSSPSFSLPLISPEAEPPSLPLSPPKVSPSSRQVREEIQNQGVEKERGTWSERFPSKKTQSFAEVASTSSPISSRGV